ncbi:THAP domain-containing protein 5-like isoform X3 [Ornithodoros turicata]|uniref:THAP domain-containing protein 5-like isoform X3 n=1 Tax=Ornithodoros turicata TaxID=34597 RepID=UPI0031394CB7
MPLRCIAVGCNNSRRTGHKMHTFPRDPKRRLEWAVKVSLAGENGKLWVPPKDGSFGLCEAHFDEDQYEPRREDRKLKPFAVPTIFAHRKQRKKRKVPKRAEAENPISQLQKLVHATSNDHTYLSAKENPDNSHAVSFTRPVTRSSSSTQSLCNTAVEVPQRDSNSGISAKDSPPKQATILMGPGGTILVPCSSSGSLPGGSPFVLVGSTLIPVSTVPGQNLLPEPTAALRPPSPQVPQISSIQSLSTGQSEGYTPVPSKSLSYEDLVQENQKLKAQLSSTLQQLSESTKQLVKVKTSLAKQSERISGFLTTDQVESLVKVGVDISWKEETLMYFLELYRSSADMYKKLLDKKYPFPPLSTLKSYCKKHRIVDNLPAELLPGQDEEDDTSNLNVVWM